MAELGVEGVWLSPIYKSPMKDFGYDISDFMEVDPIFGTLDDFKEMANRAHELGGTQRWFSVSATPRFFYKGWPIRDGIWDWLECRKY